MGLWDVLPAIEDEVSASRPKIRRKKLVRSPDTMNLGNENQRLLPLKPLSGTPPTPMHRLRSRRHSTELMFPNSNENGDYGGEEEEMGRELWRKSFYSMAVFAFLSIWYQNCLYLKTVSFPRLSLNPSRVNLKPVTLTLIYLIPDLFCSRYGSFSYSMVNIHHA